jgi:hypothetical protein
VKNPLGCIACGTELTHAMFSTEEDAMENDWRNRDSGYVFSQPNDGITLHSHGNYGSRVLDSIGEDRQVEIVVCDACLRRAVLAGNARFISRPLYRLDDKYAAHVRALAEKETG